jgi:hypothetical protein
MWIARIFYGVLQVSTASGTRYLRPCAWERLCLLWTFRNFSILPQQVLTDRQFRLVQAVCAQRRFANPEDVDPTEVIGTVEMPLLPVKRQPAPQAFGAKQQQRAS